MGDDKRVGPMGYFRSATFRRILYGFVGAVLSYIVAWSAGAFPWDWKVFAGVVAGALLTAIPGVWGRRNNALQPLRLFGGKGPNPFEPGRNAAETPADPPPPPGLSDR